MVNWARFTPVDFEYDFDRDELAAHHITFEEAVECFFGDFQVRRNKSYQDRFQWLGQTNSGRRLKIIFQTGQRSPNHYGLGYMSASKKNAKLSEQEIDKIVVSQANNDLAWTPPVVVRRTKAAALSIPAGLAARAAFLARAHHSKTVDDWLTGIIRERIELEEAAFAGAKQDLATRAS